MIEAEFVAGKVSSSGAWTSTHIEHNRIDSSEAGFEQAPTLPFEIHHAFDIPKNTRFDEAGPFELALLLEASLQLGLRVGGWYQFDKSNDWAYRSNSFASAEAVKDIAMKEWAVLNDHLNQSGVPFRLWTIVEQVLGIWRTPLSKS